MASNEQERCDGRYPVGHHRDEPFDVTYRCGRRRGHTGEHGPADPPAPRVGASKPRAPETETHAHQFSEYICCRICGQTEAAIEGCHHCGDDSSVKAGRCWWCLRPATGERRAPAPETDKTEEKTIRDHHQSQPGEQAAAWSGGDDSTPTEFLSNEPIHEWFELSYAQYLTVPRSVLQSMPVEWQRRFVTCLRQLDDTIDWRPHGGRYRVELRAEREKYKDGEYVTGWGRLIADPLRDYRRGRTRIAHRSPVVGEARSNASVSLVSDAETKK